MLRGEKDGKGERAGCSESGEEEASEVGGA